MGSHSLLTPVSAARKQRRENKNKQQTPRQSRLNPRSHLIQTSALQTSHTLSHFLECVTPLCGALHSVKNPFFLSFFWFFSLVMVVVLSKVLGFRTPYHWPRPTQSVVHRTNFLFCESVSVNCQIGAFQMLPPLLLYGSSLHTSTTGSGCYGSKSEDHHFMSTPYNSFLTHTAASLLTALLLLPLPYILYFALCSTILHFYMHRQIYRFSPSLGHLMVCIIMMLEARPVFSLSESSRL